MPPKIAFDESGNTGHRLLDPEQPVFVLSSVYFTDDEANELLDILRSPQTKEIKFKNIIKRKSGENLIIDFLKNPIIDNTRVKITVNHKGFFLFSKIVDILLESMLYKLGFDFYKNGLNIAFANLIYLTTPVFCGQSNFLDFQRSFITMIEKQNTESIYHFYSRLENLIANSKNAEFCVTLSILMDTKRFAGDILRNIDKSDLDPALPALVVLCDKWGRQFNENFDLYHDDSDVILKYKKFLDILMTVDAEKTEVGYDSRSQILPIRANGINLADSKTMPQIQIADFFAGASAYLMNSNSSITEI